MTHAIGIDIGGTFTDVVLIDGSSTPHRRKVLTTPDDLTRACVDGVRGVLADAGLHGEMITRVVHATTQGTNALLERRRPGVAFLVTEGFRDLLAICGTGRTDLYDLLWRSWQPPIDPALTSEIPERIGAHGELVRDLDVPAVEKLAETLSATGTDAVAVCLLHAYAFPEHEAQVGKILRAAMPGAYVALSSEVWPEHQEYQRAVATVLSAYIGPVMANYLSRLESRLTEIGIGGSVHVMQSNGGAMSVQRTIERPLHSLESGPAAGVLAAATQGRRAGLERLISFDMGGTTAKASLVEGGQPALRSYFRVGGDIAGGVEGVDLRLPVLDLVEVGAGGGSIANVDEGGVVRVGPFSASADPGPACYGLGGVDPTVTDANLVLGYLSESFFLGGSMRLDREQAERALDAIAAHLGMSVAEAASVIHDIANLNMGQVIQLVTIERGVDPRDFALLAFGGAGPSHAARLAESFDISTVIVPPLPGVFSSWGLLVSDVVFEDARSVFFELEGLAPADLENVFEQLERPAKDFMSENGFDLAHVRIERTLDLRRRRQAHDLNVALDGSIVTQRTLADVGAAFADQYEQRFGVRRNDDLVIHACRIRATGIVGVGTLITDAVVAPPRAKERRAAYFTETGGFTDVDVFDRSALRVGFECPGPVVIEDVESTTVVPPTWRLEVDELSNLVLTRDK